MCTVLNTDGRVGEAAQAAGGPPSNDSTLQLLGEASRPPSQRFPTSQWWGIFCFFKNVLLLQNCSIAPTARAYVKRLEQMATTQKTKGHEIENA